MTQFSLGIDTYGEFPILTVFRKDGHKLTLDGDYDRVTHTDANGAGKRAYLDPVKTWEEFSAIVKEFLEE